MKRFHVQANQIRELGGKTSYVTESYKKEEQHSERLTLLLLLLLQVPLHDASMYFTTYWLFLLIKWRIALELLSILPITS